MALAPTHRLVLQSADQTGQCDRQACVFTGRLSLLFLTRASRSPVMSRRFAGVLLAGLIGAASISDHSAAQQNPSATASSAANAAGTTVNNQSNSQINTNTFYGFGPGINCPTPTLSLSGFGGGGSGSSAGDVIGANVDSGNYGGILTFTMPIGGANAEICKEIGKAQVQALMSQVTRTQMEAAKTQADINLVTALKCVEIQRVAVLTGPFAAICQGVYARGVMTPPVSANPGGGAAVLQRFNP